MSEPKILDRYLGRYLLQEPENIEKMVFVAGPRQAGKTTLIENLGPKLGFESIVYLNWDRPKDRKWIRDIHYTFFEELAANAKTKPLVIFDELHKYPKWKAYLKGFYDTFRGKIAVFVTGSARLDVYRRGGDSLLGRYWLFRLFPFTLAESMGRLNLEPPVALETVQGPDTTPMFEALWKWGGFPDPFIHRSHAYHRRWLRMRRERLLREDLRDLSRIHDLTHVENLMDRLIVSVGSTLSVNSVREDLDVSHNAVRTWLQWLSAIYYCFQLSPYSKKVVRSIKKEAKYFLYDWSEIREEAARFENMAAVHLKKSVDFWNDTGAGNFELFYVRDHEKREVDFLILREKKPWMLVECKLSEEEIPRGLAHLAAALQAPYNVLLNNTEQTGTFRVVKGRKFWVTGAKSFLMHFV